MARFAVRPRWPGSRLSGKVGAGLDPCGAIHVPFELAGGQEREIIFRLGVGRDAEDARNWCAAFVDPAAARGALEMVWQYWKHTLGAVHVETPDQSLNVLTNGWLLYQTPGVPSVGAQRILSIGRRLRFPRSACRIRWRSSTPSRSLCASTSCSAPPGSFRKAMSSTGGIPRQDRGVRTRCSDDYLWLPLATCRYVSEHQGTAGCWMNPSTSSRAARSIRRRTRITIYRAGLQKAASLYEHCVRAILRGLTRGEHGLPLIGSGDWNDGMNMVGKQGKGESVWLGFFLYDVLMQFTKVARLRGDLSFAERCQSEAAHMRQNIEQHGWDGEWYRRAYFDDGSPLGSASNRGMPDRFDCAKLVGAVRRGRCRRAHAWPWKRAGRAPRSPGPCADPTAGSAVRQIKFESWLYQRVCSRRARKRRAVYACGDLGGDGVRRIGR